MNHKYDENFKKTIEAENDKPGIYDPATAVVMPGDANDAEVDEYLCKLYSTHKNNTGENISERDIQIYKSRGLMSVIHVNFIADNSTEGLKIYCRKERRIWAPTIEACTRCEYFDGMGQGQALECRWEDVTPTGTYPLWLVQYDERQRELERVEDLINAGILNP